MPAVPASASSPAAEDASNPIVVVGIGEDGWAGLSGAATAAIGRADLVIGSERQLALIDGHAAATQLWVMPMGPSLDQLASERLAGADARRVVILASGDPMFFGVGASLAQRFGPEHLHVIAHPSSMSLACARLGWASADVDVLSIVGRPLTGVVPFLQPGRRLLVLVGAEDAAAALAGLLVEHGLGASDVISLEHLDGPNEALQRHRAENWGGRTHQKLAVIAVDCRPSPQEAARPFPLTPGIRDDAWLSDGVMTKHEVRAITLAALAPYPGELLWDVGAGSGTIAIEWSRAHRRCRAIAIETRADRRDLITANAERFGVPSLEVVAGDAPDALAGLPTPDAIFLGGAVTREGVVPTCLDALRPGGRLVANGVTVETEVALAQWQQRVGGELTRIAISHAAPLGGFTGYRAALPVTQWTYRKPSSEKPNKDSETPNKDKAITS